MGIIGVGIFIGMEDKWKTSRDRLRLDSDPSCDQSPAGNTCGEPVFIRQMI